MGGRVQKVSLHAGFTCPNRDGTLGRGGCLYCSNVAFTPGYCHGGADLVEQMELGLAFQRRRYPRAVGFLGYLQAYTNTYGAMEELVPLYEQVLRHPHFAGLVIGTRPDCLPDALLEWLAAQARDKAIYLELGIESFSDTTLTSMNRGHSFAQAREAVERVASFGLPVGGHFLVGFPGEDWRSFFNKVDQLNALPLHSVKVHQLHVFKETPLARIYANEPERFHFPSQQEYFSAAGEWLQHLRPDMFVDRLFGDAPLDQILNPTWGVRLDVLVRAFDTWAESMDIRQGERY